MSDTPVIGHYINGAVSTQAERFSDVFNPAEGVVQARVAQATVQTVDQAVAAAEQHDADLQVTRQHRQGLARLQAMGGEADIVQGTGRDTDDVAGAPVGFDEQIHHRSPQAVACATSWRRWS